jgi:hypothetical protein
VSIFGIVCATYFSIRLRTIPCFPCQKKKLLLSDPETGVEIQCDFRMDAENFHPESVLFPTCNILFLNNLEGVKHYALV